MNRKRDYKFQNWFIPLSGEIDFNVKTAFVQTRNFPMQLIEQLIPIVLKLLILFKPAVFQVMGQPKFQVKYNFGKPFLNAGFSFMWIFFKEFEVAAKIKNQEPPFVFSGAKQSGPKPRTSTNHLPKFGIKFHRFIKYQIDNAWCINTCVHHINRNGYLLTNYLRRIVVYVILPHKLRHQKCKAIGPTNR